tara:strand:+ start:31 stop:402 length:372 start_codon:yes stop_codon:yes gene_type:complete
MKQNTTKGENKVETVNYIETAEGSEMQIKEVKIGTRNARVGELQFMTVVNTVSNEHQLYTNEVNVMSTTHQDEVQADAVLTVKTAVETPEDETYRAVTAIGMSKSEMLNLYKSLQYILFEDIN